MTIAVKFENPTTFIDSLELVDGDGNIIPIDMVKYTRGGIGTFTPTVTCEVGKDKLTVHLKNSTNVNGFQQLGLVGSVQGWNPDAAVNPTGIDSKGNFVFEVCVDTTTDEQAFKILYEGELDSGFAWGDPELTPGDVLFTFDGDVTLYVEEGNSVAGSVYQTIMLLDANKLDVTKEYMLQFVDENGFVVYLELDIDNEAPVITPTIKPDVPFEINSDETFDLMDYFNVINVIDNRDGEMMYEIVQTLDLSVAGEQTVIIKAVDAWMNEATKSFVFTVIDVEFPVLTLTVTELTLTVGDEIPTWSDYATTTEGTITIDVSQVDLTTAGTFFVKFTAEDAAGNKDTESIEVTVELGEEVDDSPLSGCFSSIGNSFVVYLAGVIALIGGAGLFFIKRH